MKKIILFIPAIILVALYGFIQIGVGLRVSPILLFYIAIFIISGILLLKGKFWGGAFGVAPGIYLVYMSTKHTGQIINIELLMGVFVTLFYLISCVIVLQKSKKTAM